MRKPLIYIFALIVLLIAAFFIWSKAPRLEEPQIQAATSSPALELTMVERDEDTDAYAIQLQYPQFGDEAIDARIRAHVERAVDSFKTYASEGPPDSAFAKSEQNISFNRVYTGPDVVSVEMLISEYTGGAHPNSVILGINVDPETGRELSLDDALSLIDRSLEQVAASTDAQLREKLGEAYFAEGATPKAENYATFLVDKDEVTFVFNAYQVGPYAAGAQKISFDRVR